MHRPLTLYIIADGPRPAQPLDDELCKQVREIVEFIDWPCNVYRNFSEVNLGTKQRVISGLNWVFEQEEQAIILEDDCLPNEDFFRFSNQILEKYADDHRVATITGNNFQKGHRRGTSSYYFSKYTHSWGWATWRRTWNQLEPDIPFWPEWKMTKDWRKKTPDLVERLYWQRIFDQQSRHNIDAWDYPLLASIWRQGGMTVTPNVNLVSNIGFGEFATHTYSVDSWLSEIPTSVIGEVTHPKIIEQNIEADLFVFNEVFGGKEMRFPRIILQVPKVIFRFAIRKIQGG